MLKLTYEEAKVSLFKSLQADEGIKRGLWVNRKLSGLTWKRLFELNLINSFEYFKATGRVKPEHGTSST